MLSHTSRTAYKPHFLLAVQKIVQLILWKHVMLPLVGKSFILLLCEKNDFDLILVQAQMYVITLLAQAMYAYPVLGGGK